jgi:hypothetical protein
MADEGWRELPDPVADAEIEAVSVAERNLEEAKANLAAAKAKVDAREQAEKPKKAAKKK